MIQIEFSAEEIANLEKERYSHPSPQVQRRLEAVYLKSQNLSHQDIRRICHISKPTLCTYLKTYQTAGIDGLKQRNYQGQASQLNPYQGSLEHYFSAHPPKSIAEAQFEIERLTGIKRSPTQIREFLKKLGVKRRKVGHIPGKATSPDKIKEQDKFQKEQLEPRLNEAKEGKRTLFL